MEVFGGSSGKKKYVSQKMLQKLAKGGAKADRINELSNSHHDQFDVPSAERLIDENIESAYAVEKKDLENEKSRGEKTFWEKVKYFIQRIFFPVSHNEK